MPKIRVYVVTTFELQHVKANEVKAATKALCEEKGEEFVALLPEKVAAWAKRQFAGMK